MPNLRCPSCYYSTTIRKDAITGVKCSTCEYDLFDYYYKNRSASEAASFIAEKNVELKKKKGKADRATRKSAHGEKTYVTEYRNEYRTSNAMPQCPSCGVDVGYNAQACPNCGLNINAIHEEAVSKLMARTVLSPIFLYLTVVILGLRSGVFDPNHMFFQVQFWGFNWIAAPSLIISICLIMCKQVWWGGWLVGPTVGLWTYYGTSYVVPNMYPFN